MLGSQGTGLSHGLKLTDQRVDGGEQRILGRQLHGCCILVIIFFVDPMNALQNLTGGPPAGAPGMGMASRAQGAPMSGMSGLGPMGQQMSLPGQQQPPGTSGMAPHGMPGVSTATQQSKCSVCLNH